MAAAVEQTDVLGVAVKPIVDRTKRVTADKTFSELNKAFLAHIEGKGFGWGVLILNAINHNQVNLRQLLKYYPWDFKSCLMSLFMTPVVACEWDNELVKQFVNCDDNLLFAVARRITAVPGTISSKRDVTFIGQDFALAKAIQFLIFSREDDEIQFAKELLASDKWQYLTCDDIFKAVGSVFAEEYHIAEDHDLLSSVFESPHIAKALKQKLEQLLSDPDLFTPSRLKNNTFATTVRTADADNATAYIVLKVLDVKMLDLSVGVTCESFGHFIAIKALQMWKKCIDARLTKTINSNAFLTLLACCHSLEALKAVVETLEPVQFSRSTEGNMTFTVGGAASHTKQVLTLLSSPLASAIASGNEEVENFIQLH